MNPKMQKAFGQGDNGSYNAETSNSWGPAMGTEYTLMDKSALCSIMIMWILSLKQEQI